VFFGITVIVMGFAAYMTGQALANTWKPAWQAVVYSLLLGGVDRFLVFALFEGKLLSVSGYLIDTLVLIALAIFAFQVTRANKMVAQYPWLYQRHGPFGWRSRVKSDGAQTEQG